MSEMTKTCEVWCGGQAVPDYNNVSHFWGVKAGGRGGAWFCSDLCSLNGRPLNPPTRSGTDALERPAGVEMPRDWGALIRRLRPGMRFSVGRDCEGHMAGEVVTYKDDVQFVECATTCCGSHGISAFILYDFHGACTFLGYAETPGEAPVRVAGTSCMCPCSDCTKCSCCTVPSAKPAEPPKPTPPVIVRREVSCDGKHWVDYARLVDADPFEAYPWRRTWERTMWGETRYTLDAFHAPKPDPIANPRITVTASDAAGAAAAALVGR